MTEHELAQLLPKDLHNQQLEANVHPPHWTNPTPSGNYNLVVIGAGTAGLVTAAGAAGLGAKVALIELELMGRRLPQRWLRSLERCNSRSACCSNST